MSLIIIKESYKNKNKNYQTSYYKKRLEKYLISLKENVELLVKA
jgi:hypothetical protein